MGSKTVAQLYATLYNSNGDSYAHKNKKQCGNLRKIFTIMNHSILKSLINFRETNVTPISAADTEIAYATINIIGSIL